MLYSMFRINIIFLVLILSSCGGGGGSSGDVVTINGYSYSPSSLSFTAQIDAATPADQVLTLTASQPQSSVPNLSANYDAIDYITSNIVNSTTVEITVKVVSPAVIGVGVHAASVDVSSTDYSVSIPVNYTVTALPPGPAIVNYAAPYIILPSTQSNIIIRGSGFSRYDATNLPSVTIGSLPATNIAIVSDSEIHVTTPSLSIGTHGIEMQGDGTVFTSNASISVLAAQTFATASFANSGEKSALIYDKKRSALYVVNTTSDNLDRYTFQSGTNWTVDSLTLSGLTDAAISPDGDTLVLIDGSSFYEADPSAVSLSVGTGTAAPLLFMQSLDRIAAANDGTLVAVNDNQWSALYTYELQTTDTSVLSYTNSSNIVVNWSIFSPWIFESPNGSSIYLGEHGSSASTLYQLSTSDYDLTTTGVPDTSFGGHYDVATTPDESIFLVNGQDIYNATLTTLQGSLPQTHSASSISPDGTIAYVYLDFTNILRAYDISDPSLPVQIGSDINLTNGAGMRPLMRISDDGNTLFLVGLDYLHIIDLTTFSF